jgi:hypothetical protein
MKKIVLLSAITIALTAASANTARAGISFGINVGIPFPAVVLPAPPPIYVPAPYCAPRVLVAPPPVYVAPTPVYYHPYPRHHHGYVRYGHGHHHYVHHRGYCD